MYFNNAPLPVQKGRYNCWGMQQPTFLCLAIFWSFLELEKVLLLQLSNKSRRIARLLPELVVNNFLKSIRQASRRSWAMESSIWAADNNNFFLSFPKLKGQGNIIFDTPGPGYSNITFGPKWSTVNINVILSTLTSTHNPNLQTTSNSLCRHQVSTSSKHPHHIHANYFNVRWTTSTSIAQADIVQGSSLNVQRSSISSHRFFFLDECSCSRWPFGNHHDKQRTSFK